MSAENPQPQEVQQPNPVQKALGEYNQELLSSEFDGLKVINALTTLSSEMIKAGRNPQETYGQLVTFADQSASVAEMRKNESAVTALRGLSEEYSRMRDTFASPTPEVSKPTSTEEMPRMGTAKGEIFSQPKKETKPQSDHATTSTETPTEQAATEAPKEEPKKRRGRPAKNQTPPTQE